MTPSKAKALIADLKAFIEDAESAEKQRSPAQNNALHLFCTQLASELNTAGFDMKAVLKPEVDIPWTMQSVKDCLWRPIQRLKTGKESTTDLTTQEVGDVYDILNRHLGEKTGVHVPWPSAEELSWRGTLEPDS